MGTEREYILHDTPPTYAQRFCRSTKEVFMVENTAWGKALFTVHLDNSETKRIEVGGRERWALECLIAAGSKGCTPIDTPGPRWSAYAFSLRQLGVKIETLNEPHGGPFRGTHGRYKLVSRVVRHEPEGVE